MVNMPEGQRRHVKGTLDGEPVQREYQGQSITTFRMNVPDYDPAVGTTMTVMDVGIADERLAAVVQARLRAEQLVSASGTLEPSSPVPGQHPVLMATDVSAYAPEYGGETSFVEIARRENTQAQQVAVPDTVAEGMALSGAESSGMSR